MHIQELFEDVDNDLAMAKQASKAAFFVSKAIYNGYTADHLVEIGNKGDFLLYDAHNLGLDDLFPFTSDMCILFGHYLANTVGKSGSYSFYPDRLFMDKYRKSITIHGLREISDESAKKLANSTEFIEIFRHEFIHLLDGQRTNQRIFNNTPQKYDPKQPQKHDNGAYYNDSAECNARYHDIVYHLTSLINDATSDKTTPEDMRDLADLYGITGDFKTDLVSMLGKSMHIRQFVKWINDDRRKALLKRIYKLHHHVVELINKAAAKN